MSDASRLMPVVQQGVSLFAILVGRHAPADERGDEVRRVYDDLTGLLISSFGQEQFTTRIAPLVAQLKNEALLAQFPVLLEAFEVKAPEPPDPKPILTSAMKCALRTVAPGNLSASVHELAAKLSLLPLFFAFMQGALDIVASDTPPSAQT